MHIVFIIKSVFMQCLLFMLPVHCIISCVHCIILTLMFPSGLSGATAPPNPMRQSVSASVGYRRTLPISVNIIDRPLGGENVGLGGGWGPGGRRSITLDLLSRFWSGISLLPL